MGGGGVDEELAIVESPPSCPEGRRVATDAEAGVAGEDDEFENSLSFEASVLPCVEVLLKFVSDFGGGAVDWASGSELRNMFDIFSVRLRRLALFSFLSFL